MEALAGTLKTAKKHGVVKYDNEMLFQGQHDDVIINLLKSEIPDATADTCALSVPEGGREREREGDTGRTGVRKSEGGGSNGQRLVVTAPFCLVGSPPLATPFFPGHFLKRSAGCSSCNTVRCLCAMDSRM